MEKIGARVLEIGGWVSLIETLDDTRLY